VSGFRDVTKQKPHQALYLMRLLFKESDIPDRTLKPGLPVVCRALNYKWKAFNQELLKNSLSDNLQTYPRMAMVSISISTPRGNSFTAKAARAGGFSE